jgi:ABC-2 type transport system ATP-binding protein
LNSDKNRIAVLLEKVGLSDHGKKPVKKFSRGMKQRLVLARAMLNNPKILFLDEPTSGLDPSTSVEIHKLMLGMKSGGTTFFLTTHNMTEAAKLCDRIALLNEGTIAELGTLEELSQKYNTEKRVKLRLDTGEEAEIALTPENSSKIAELVNQNRIINIHSQEPTLEQIFLKVTGRELA